VCLATGYIVTICRTDDDDASDNSVTYGQSIRCDEGRVINIISARVGYSRQDECTIDYRVQCRRRTNNSEIMKCNGRRNCSLGLDTFNYTGNFTCRQWRRLNFIEITYNCISGKRTCLLSRYVVKIILYSVYYNDQICPSTSSVLLHSNRNTIQVHSVSSRPNNGT